MEAVSDRSLPEIDFSGLQGATCCLCRTADSRLLFHVGQFQIVRCNGCRLVYLTPQVPPDKLSGIYQETYWASPAAKDLGYTDYLGDRDLYRRTFRRRLERHVLSHVRRGRLLDVGCAAGLFLKEASRAGFETAGVDVSRPMVEFARNELKLEHVALGTLQDCRFADGAFDVVTLWDVVEHVPDPPELLREVRRVMSRDGYLILETQNERSLFARMMGRRWHHYKVPEHLFHFGPETCARLLREAGFDVVSWTSRNAGKYVPLSFVVERSARVSRFLPKLLAPLATLRKTNLYVNLHDEMVFIARPTGAAVSGGMTPAQPAAPQALRDDAGASLRVTAAA
jgi:2-polyprenyl-3-methyl-5-hydroxy-6-metoxy-1,4-benzoquinol methylase